MNGTVYASPSREYDREYGFVQLLHMPRNTLECFKQPSTHISVIIGVNYVKSV